MEEVLEGDDLMPHHPKCNIDHDRGNCRRELSYASIEFKHRIEDPPPRNIVKELRDASEKWGGLPLMVEAADYIEELEANQVWDYDY